MTRFTDDAWQRNRPLFHATLALPFNQELAALWHQRNGPR